MLELLLALAIVSVGFLALLKWQTEAVYIAKRHYYHSKAVAQLWAMVNRLRLNHTNASRQNALNAWNSNNADYLPSGHGFYRCTQLLHHCQVTLSWQLAHRHVLTLRAAI